MLIYNTTFHVEDDVVSNFLIWLEEYYIPEILREGTLLKPRLCKILSHIDEGSAFSLQCEVESTGALHRWHLSHGVKLNEEMVKVFKDKVVAFPTMMEVIA